MKDKKGKKKKTCGEREDDGKKIKTKEINFNIFFCGFDLSDGSLF